MEHGSSSVADNLEHQKGSALNRIVSTMAAPVGRHPERQQIQVSQKSAFKKPIFPKA